jgi:hypothetical protein
MLQWMEIQTQEEEFGGRTTDRNVCLWQQLPSPTPGESLHATVKLYVGKALNATNLFLRILILNLAFNILQILFTLAIQAHFLPHIHNILNIHLPLPQSSCCLLQCSFPCCPSWTVSRIEVFCPLLSNIYDQKHFNHYPYSTPKLVSIVYSTCFHYYIISQHIVSWTFNLISTNEDRP